MEIIIIRIHLSQSYLSFVPGFKFSVYGYVAYIPSISASADNNIMKQKLFKFIGFHISQAEGQ